MVRTSHATLLVATLHVALVSLVFGAGPDASALSRASRSEAAGQVVRQGVRQEKEREHAQKQKGAQQPCAHREDKKAHAFSVREAVASRLLTVRGSSAAQQGIKVIKPDARTAGPQRRLGLAHQVHKVHKRLDSLMRLGFKSANTASTVKLPMRDAGRCRLKPAPENAHPVLFLAFSTQPDLPDDEDLTSARTSDDAPYPRPVAVQAGHRDTIAYRSPVTQLDRPPRV